MGTLYVRIISMTMIIIIVSTIAAFLMTNSHYHNHLKPANDDKLTNIAIQIGEILEENSKEFIPEYLSRISTLGYKLHVVDDRKSTRLNSSHVAISYAVFCLKKKKKKY